MRPSTANPAAPRPLARFAQRHALLLYCVLAFAFSWGYWLALLARGERVGPGSSATHLPGLCGPFLAALVVTALAEGMPGLVRLLRSCVRLPVPRWRSALLALSPLLLGALIFAALAAFGHPLPSLRDFNTYPGIPQAPSLGVAAVVALLLNGLGEEGGWRGFALPRLAQGRSRLRAALAVAGIWLLWHAPLFVLNTSMAALLGPALLGWALGLTAGSLVLAWLYFQGRSVLLVAVWHTAFNFLVATAPGQGLVAAVGSTVVMLLAVAVAAAWRRAPAQTDDLGRPQNSSPPTTHKARRS
ncbi:CPBP family intramembrane glutamic endopeptidase [Acidovorax sp. M2(2025)]|uniref:CPBP family intramembrane glutamic endopeptidase n=1 Tax=Acidovorax sp. M2(2025) TaxID=3411355 RepID=UPI003BF4A2B3